MTKRRQLLQTIENTQEKRHGRILVLTGARQVGKTTLVKLALPNYSYLSIEDPVMRPAYARLSAAQWHSLYPKAILDEVQKEPQLIESIKATFDQYDDVRFALLGSSQLLLLEKVKETLAGRCIIYEMFPLTLPELQTSSWEAQLYQSYWQQLLLEPSVCPDFYPSFAFDNRMAEKQVAWQHYLRYGGYPALVAEQLTDEDRFEWLANYVRTYLERDIRDLASFRDLEPFIKMQHATALHTAKVLNASNMAKDIGISPKTVLRYLEYLRISYQTIILPSWERNPTKRLVKAPKIHYLDNGVLQAVLQKRGGITGEEFESLVVAELYKQAKNMQANVSFHHLRTHDGKEVDLLVELPAGYFAFEIKRTEHVSQTDARHLLDLDQILDKPLLQGFVLSNDWETHRFSDKVQALNVTMFLS